MLTINWIQRFKAEVETELTGRILPFWTEQTVDEEYEGFYGQISNDLKINKEADKGCILNSRILWTFASAYRQSMIRLDHGSAHIITAVPVWK